MNIVEKKNINQYSANELNNLSKNIRAKAIKLGITLPKLAEMINIDYVTLTRIVNPKDDYMPNLKALAVIASFFEVGIGDLLTNPDMPQYVPILQLYEVETFLKDNNFKLTGINTVFSNEFVHEKAFAISVSSEYFGQILEIKFLLKPYDKIKINSHVLLKLNDKFYFLKIIEYSIDYIIGNNLQENVNIQLTTKGVKVIAIATKMLFNNKLI